jgi:hypothetical protein
MCCPSDKHLQARCAKPACVALVIQDRKTNEVILRSSFTLHRLKLGYRISQC